LLTDFDSWTETPSAGARNNNEFNAANPGAAMSSADSMSGMVVREENKGFRVPHADTEELKELIATRCWLFGQEIHEFSKVPASFSLPPARRKLRLSRVANR
jgi:hypothetical protein